METQSAREERMDEIGVLLLENRRGTEDWGEMSCFKGEPCPQKVANKFLLCCLLDWQMESGLAWRNGERLANEILGDPDDVWRAITSVSEAEWKLKREKYKLHRFPAAHNRLWHIARDICDRYQGDASRIWQGKESSAVLDELLALGAGKQISRMIVGALRDCGQISGSSDVKADIYVRRVLGRAVFGEPTNAAAAAELARHINPADPWQLDWPLWNVGKSYCSANNPRCKGCYLASCCAYESKNF